MQDFTASFVEAFRLVPGFDAGLLEIVGLSLRVSLTAVAVAALATASARVLSGGERQRLALVRALAAQPDVLFLDEPTSSLDPASLLAIEAMVQAASSRGTRIVLIAHDLAQARRIGEKAPTDRFFDAPQSAEAAAFVAGKILIS